jgi:sugar transferase (PEP-CTERM/EpsH1 system associated)
MNILVIDEEFPHPLNTGKRIRSFNLIRRLAARHEVRYLAYGFEDSDGFQALREVGVEPVPVPHRLPQKSGPFFYLRLLANLMSSYPYTVSSHYTDLFARTLQSCLAQNKPDLILCEWSPYAIFVKETSGVKKAIVAHNIEARIWRRYWENETQPLKRWYIKKQMLKMERYEQSAFHWVDGATAVTADEAGVITSYNPHLPVEVVPNGVDLAYFTPSNENYDANRLVFTGAMDWRPNQDAVLYFTRAILPLLRQKLPRLHTVIVGRNPPRDIMRLNELPDITVTGTVDDVRPYVWKAAAFIVPLRIGGGSRLKILEALAMRKAVITTSVGAEGLEVTPDREVLMADTPEEFARQVEKVLSDDKLNRRLGTTGRMLVEQRYSWDSLADRLERFLIRLVETS